jgi:predicted membrane channel-forming protein YqfA (hemolysin III family)
MPFLLMAGMVVANLMGALIFVTRVGSQRNFGRVFAPNPNLLNSLQVPERWFPHKFDLLGCSHQILHIAVLVAACLHFVTLVKASTSTRNETCVREHELPIDIP